MFETEQGNAYRTHGVADADESGEAEADEVNAFNLETDASDADTYRTDESELAKTEADAYGIQGAADTNESGELVDTGEVNPTPVAKAPNRRVREEVTLAPQAKAASGRPTRCLWLLPSVMVGATDVASNDVVMDWDAVDAAPEERARTFGEFDVIVIGPVYLTKAEGRNPLDRLGVVWFALGELARRRVALTILLPGREESTQLECYRRGTTSWSLRASTRELITNAGWRFGSRMKVCNEEIITAAAFAPWREHIIPRDDSIDAPGIGNAWAVYEHGEVVAGWYRWGRARVLVFPFNPARGWSSGDVAFVREAAVDVLGASEVVPMIVDLRLGPKRGGANYAYLADDTRHDFRLDRKEAAFILAFLVELHAGGGVPRVPDHVLEARLATFDYDDKVSSVRSTVNKKLASAIESWGFLPYDVFSFGRANTLLTYPNQFARVLGLDPASA